MSQDEQNGPATGTGFELQDALVGALGDPIGDELAELDPAAVLALLGDDRDIVDVRRFLSDHRVPARRPDLAAARRVLPAIRRDRGVRRSRTVRWLTWGLRADTHQALVHAVGPPAAALTHREVDLGELVDRFGPTAVRLAVLSQLGSGRGELDLAMLLVDGRVVPDRWRPHLDRLGPLAAKIVEEFSEEYHAEDLEPGEADAALADAYGDLGVDGAVVDDLTGVPDAPLPGDFREGTSAAEAGAAQDTAEPDRRRDEKTAAGSVTDRPTAVGPGAARLGEAEAEALAALAVMEEAAARFAAALGRVRDGAGRPAARFAAMEPVGADMDELRTLARQVLAGAADPADAAFLDALAHLADLAAGGADDDALMAAEDEVLSYPAAARVRAAVFAAGRGRLHLPAGSPLDTPLAEWLTPDSAELLQRLAGRATDPAAPVPSEVSAGPAAAPLIPMKQPDSSGAAIDADLVRPLAPAAETSGSATPLASAAETAETAETAESATRVAPAADGAGEGAVIGTGQPPELAVTATSAEAPGVDDEATTEDQAPASPAGQPADAGREELGGVYAPMLAAGRWGLARWVAKAAGDTARADALEAVAYADGIRLSTGPLAVALTTCIDAMTPQALGGDRAAQVLAVAAATRAALVAPFTGVSGALGVLARVFDEDAPGIAAIADAATETARHGVAFTGEVLTALGGEAAADAKIATLVAAADAMLSRTGRTGFARADHIWSEWVSAGGPVHDLLAPVAGNDPGRLVDVRTAVFEYGKDSVQAQRLRASDDRYRGPGKARIEGPARNALLGRLREALRTASAWVELHSAAVSARASDREAVVAARLRETLRAHRSAVEASLAAWAGGPDAEMAGAAHGAAGLYVRTFNLVEGTPLIGEEQPASALLDVDLLRTPVALDADLAPLDPDAIKVQDLAGAEQRSWEEAFEARCAAGDHGATAAIVAAVGATDPARSAQLGVARASALAEARDDAAARAGVLASQLEAARRAGRLDEDTATDLELRIERAQLPDRVDLGAVAAELDEVAAALDVAAADAAEAFRARLAEAASLPAYAGAMFRFDHLLAEGDLATAEELLLQLNDGVAQPTEHRPDIDVGSFFPGVVEHLSAGVTPELIDAAVARKVNGPLDFGALSPEAAEDAVAALRAWRQMAVGERQVRKAAALAPALRVLGIEFRGERHAGLPGSNDRAWLDLTQVERVPQTLVPAFGTYAGAEQRLLLVWKQPGESLLQWVEQDPSERPVLVLYFGTLSAEARVRIANRLRGQPRPVAVVDDAVLAWAASLGRQTFEVTMRATLPFTAVNPYQPGIAGAVPEEMFYGRVAERSAVMSATGTSLIYGGRRLGKSALLRAAERRFGAVPGQTAVYIDLSAAGVRSRGRPEAVWDLIAARLVEVGVAERPGGRRAPGAPYEHADRAVRSYLSVADNRRLLLLLDECDDFFDIDAESDFVQTRRLKDLMESTGHRFKVVFAGLHQVARFSSYPNQPLAHLGKPLAIGPLAPQPAYNLIAKPFRALGWQFASDDLINRVLAYCNYTPILLQEFGQTLVGHLYERRLEAGEPPSTVTAADIDAVLSSGSLADAIRSRFNLTLSLDPRYKMIAYVLALEAHTTGRRALSAAMTTGDLLEQCREWWPEGFAQVNNDEFRALLDELVGLGVLSPDRGAWRMRSPNVLRLLGTKPMIEAGLIELVRENPTAGSFFSADAHRLIEGTSGRLRSPLTEQQLADVIGEGHNRLRVVVGTAATGADSVHSALAAAQALTGRWELIVPSKPAVFERSVVDGTPGRHRLVFADLRGVNPDAILRAVEASAKHPAKSGATCAVVIVVDPDALGVVEEALAAAGVDDAAVVPLRRYTPAGLRAWAVEVEAGFTEDGTRRRLAEVTGGWPLLVDEIEAAVRSQSARRALDEMEAGLPGRANWLVGQLGLDRGRLAEAWATVIELLGNDSSEPAEVLGGLLDDSPAIGESLVRALEAAGVLIDHDGRLSLEQVSAAAWRHAPEPQKEEQG